ncbi:MAG: carbohydrate kinase family protein [Rhizobiaceae bacterium]
MTKRPRLLVVGGAHIDRRGQVRGPYVPGASNPGTLSEEIGGGGFNAARNAAQRGVSASMLSVRGGDAAGNAVAEAIRQARIADLSAVFLDRRTASYTAMVQEDGEVIAGLADMQLYDAAFPRILARSGFRAAAAEADAILCDANLPAAALARVAATGKPLYGIAISPAKAVRLEGLLDAFSCLFLNRREASVLCGLPADADFVETAAALAAKGLRAAVVTAGPEAVNGYDAQGRFSIEPPKPRHVADETGAGDAIAGATVAAMLRGVPLAPALREGMAAALLTIESPHAVTKLDAKAMRAALALVPEPRHMA